jgi:hypothetical protein
MKLQHKDPLFIAKFNFYLDTVFNNFCIELANFDAS